jgi:hypothetical protein
MAPTPETAAKINQLGSVLDKEIKRKNRHARGMYFLAHTMMVITVGASAAASLCGFLGVDSKITGGVAAIPAITVIIAMTFKPEQRANWHYRKRDALAQLKRRLIYELPDSPTADNVAAISKALSELIMVMNEQWVKDLTLSWTTFKKHE